MRGAIKAPLIEFCSVHCYDVLLEKGSIMNLCMFTESLKNHKKFLFFLFIFSAVLRLSALLFYFQYNPCMTMFDAGHYHALAQSILHSFEFTGADGASYFYRLPGYPFFLAIIYFFAGVNPVIALAIQGFIASVIPVLIFFLGRILFPTTVMVAYGSSLLVAMHIGYVIYANLIMAETLFCIFFLFFLIFFYRKKFLFAGLMLGIASLIRPVGQYVLVVALGLRLLECNRSWRNYLRNALMFFAGWIAVAGWWLVRNYVLTGMFIFHTLSGPHFLNHSAVRLAMAHDHISYTQAKELVQEQANLALADAENKQKKSLNQAQESAIMERVALQYFKKNWMQSFKHCAINIFKTTFSLYSSELLVIEQHGKLPAYEEHRSLKLMIKRFLFPEVKNPFIRFFIYYELVLWIFVLIGFLGYGISSLFYSAWFGNVIRLMPFILLFLVLSCACGFARLRLPVEHFLTMLAMAFWVNVLRIKK